MATTRAHRTTILLAVFGLTMAAISIAQQHTLIGGGIPPKTSPILAEAPRSQESLYDRLGGVFSISAVVDHFSDALIENPVVGRSSKNPMLRKWSTENLDRLPGLKFMRTLWVCKITGGPFEYTPTRPGKTNLGLEQAHRALNISSKEFDEVAAELGRTLDHFGVPKQEKSEVLAAFAAHKHEVLGR